MPLTSAEKAIKREEIAKRRNANRVITELLPIVHKNAKLISNGDPLIQPILTDIGIMCLSHVLSKPDFSFDTWGSYKYIKLCVRGWMFNGMRDCIRPYRIPRDLSTTYLKKCKLLRESTVSLTQSQIAEKLGVTVEYLNEVDEAANLYTNELSENLMNHTEPLPSQDVSPEESSMMDLAGKVIEEGIRVVSRKYQLDPEYVTDVFTRSMKTIINDKLNVNT